MSNGCVDRSLCDYWFCNEKNKCLFDRKNTGLISTMKRHKQPAKKKAASIKKARSKKSRQNRAYWSKLHTKRVVSLIMKGHDAACVCCGSINELTFDHVIPLAKGGSNYLSNGQILCNRCNRYKSDKIITINELRKIIKY